MPAPVFKPLEQSVADMIRTYEHRSGVPADTIKGSILRTNFEAVGFKLEELSYGVDQAVTEAIPEATYAAFGFAKVKNQKAKVYIRFGRSLPSSEPITIPAGTQVQTLSGIIFVTLSDAVLTQPAVYIDVLAESLEAGSIANVLANSLNIPLTLIPGIEYTTNPLDATGGVDEEDTATQAQRFADEEAKLAKGTLPAYEALAKDVILETGERAFQVSALDNFLNAELELGVIEVWVYVPGGATQGLLDAIKTYLYLPENRRGGVEIRVYAVEIIPYDLIVTVRSSSPSAITDTTNLCYQYNNALKIGENVDRERLSAVLKPDSVAYKVSITEPATDIIVQSNQRAEVGNVVVNVSSGGSA
jgi:phage-related baseplate assembly protein